MPAAWKIVLIGGEVTVLAAFTGIGIHLAMQPHRPGLLPPAPILLPVASALAPTPGQRPAAIALPAATPLPGQPPGVTADWISRLGHSDRNLLTSQWDIVQSLIGAIERYLRDRVVPDMQRRR